MRLFFPVILIFAALSANGQGELTLPIDSAGFVRLINTKGEYLTGWVAMDEIIYMHRHDHYLARRKDKWGVVDTELNFVIQPYYDTIYSCYSRVFAESIGKLDIYTDSMTHYKTIEDFVRLETDGPGGDYNPTYPYIVHTYDHAAICGNDFAFNPSLLFDDAFFLNDVIFLRKENAYGFITSRDSVIPPVFTSICFFNSAVMELADGAGHRHYFLKTGQLFPDSDSTLQYDRTYKMYKIYKNGKGFLYDENLLPVVEYTGDDIFCIHQPPYYATYKKEYLFAVKQNNKIGVMDWKGSMIIQPAFEHITYADTNRFIAMDSSKFGIVDQSGSWLIPPVYTYISYWDRKFFELQDYEKKGIADKSCVIIVPVLYDEVECFAKGIVTKSSTGHGFYNDKGKQVLQNRYTRVYPQNQGFFMFESSTERFLINEDTILTPLNCEKIHVGYSSLKYYVADQVVVYHLEKGKITDTMVYDRPESLVITSRNETPIELGEVDFAEFRSQLNGKIGSIRKEDVGFAIEPVYDNLFVDYSTDMVKWPYASGIRVGELSFQSKEKLMGFHGAYGVLGAACLSYLGERSSTTWHSSALDPFIALDNSFHYHRSNTIADESVDMALAREGQTSIGISGHVNLASGQEVVSYREYFNQLNSYYNLVIDNPAQFSLLSTSPMIRVESPTWRVIEAPGSFEYKLRGTFEQYQEFKGNYVKWYEDGRYTSLKYDYRGQNPEKFADLLPYWDGADQNYYVAKPFEDLGGITEIKWTVYNSTGQWLKEFYPKVRALHSGYFTVWQGGLKQVVDASGKVIYTYPKKPLAP